jgi:formylglycine-generating enzyme required for sulfatase activity
MFEGSDGFARTAPVGSFRAGDSRWGVHDMAGNVGEWTSSAYCPYPQNRCANAERVYRGGGWAAVLKTTVQATRRAWSLPTARDADRGFRCAASVGRP